MRPTRVRQESDKSPTRVWHAPENGKSIWGQLVLSITITYSDLQDSEFFIGHLDDGMNWGNQLQNCFARQVGSRGRAAVLFALLTVPVLSFAQPADRATDGAKRQVTSSLGRSLGSIFDPRRAPAQKSMGLLQRSFLDLVESSRPQLQVAIVVDGTDSMASTIDDVRQAISDMTADLVRYRGFGNVSFGLVVYRDQGAPSGTVTTPLPRFSAETAVLERVVQDLKPETGEPYFPELADVGVHAALQELNWSDDPDTSKWLILIGDAPPYRKNFTDPKTGSERKYSEELLVNLAQKNQVRISSILCESRPDQKSVYNELVPETRQFMNHLATNTGGLMLDLSFPDIRAAIADAARLPEVPTMRVGLIEMADVEARRRDAEKNELTVAASRRVRIAILPHLPLDEMSFRSQNEAVQVAAELRAMFGQLPRVETTNPLLISRELRRIQADAVAKDDWLRALAVRLRVDYLVWGSYQKTESVVRLQSSIYDREEGRRLVTADREAKEADTESKLTLDVVDALLVQAAALPGGTELGSLGRALRGGNPGQPPVLAIVVNADIRSDVWLAYDSLEKATGVERTAEESAQLLSQATTALENAVEKDPRNPFVYQLLASCYHNLAAAKTDRGKTEEGQAYATKYAAALNRAYRDRARVKWPVLRKEIEADYQLLVRKDVAAAIELYSELADDRAANPLGTAQRAHWMLAGIHAGDWVSDPDSIDLEEARDHLVDLLAHWPESVPAQAIRTSLRWSEEKGHNEFEHLPLKNQFMADVDL